MPLTEALERMIARPPQELPAWALHIQQSHQVLMSQLDILQTASDVGGEEKGRLVGLVRKRVLNLRETIRMEQRVIRPEFKVAELPNDFALVFVNTAEPSVRKVPEGLIGVDFLSGWITVNNLSSTEPVPFNEWCADPKVVRGVASGLLTELPAGVRYAIKNPKNPNIV